MNNQNKKKKKGGGGALLVFLLIFVLPRLFEALEGADFQNALWKLRYWAYRRGLDPRLLLPILAACVIVIFVLIAAVSAARKKRLAEAGASRVRINTSAGRTAAAAQRADPRSRSFVPPEPSCIVCDHTGEDHFVRDKAQRIAQLDEWLKNGLIDREEYRVLKSRYERDL